MDERDRGGAMRERETAMCVRETEGVRGGGEATSESDNETVRERQTDNECLRETTSERDNVERDQTRERQ